MKDKLRLGVVGVGHFGRHHARVYSELEDVRLVGVADTSVERADAVAARHGVPAFTDYRLLFGRVDAVSVAVPTAAHAAVSCDFLSRGISVLVEKPMAATLADALRMQDAANASGARLQVGHIMRFSPLVVAMREMDLVPRLLDIHRMSPFAFRSLDVGVVLDMMIHDIDLVLCLVRSRVEKVDATAFAVVGPHEDVCNARVVFDDGCVANLTASRVAPSPERTARVFSADTCLSVDFQAHAGFVLRKSHSFSLDDAHVEKMRALSPEDLKKFAPAEPFTLREMKLDDEEPLKAELRSFVTSVRDGRTPVVSSEDGVRSMDLAEKILEAARKNHHRMEP
jgi:predicted dehydrogenase